MSMKLKKALIRALPYILFGLVCTNLGEAWRLSETAAAPSRLLGFMASISLAFSNPMPSFHPIDLAAGILCGCVLRLAVYLKSKNAKNYKHGQEYGSARWSA